MSKRTVFGVPPFTDADFASLLEREPSDASDSIEDWMQKCEDAAKRNLTLRGTLDSAASRIKELEGVLVAVRTGIVTIQCHTTGMWNEEVKQRQAALSHIVALINETLDPCKPWCVLEPGHGGACCPQEDERE